MVQQKLNSCKSEFHWRIIFKTLKKEVFVSIHNKLKELRIPTVGASNTFNFFYPDLFQEIIQLESNYYQLRNDSRDLEDELEQARYREKQLLIEADKYENKFQELEKTNNELHEEKLELMHQVTRNTHKDELIEISKKIKNKMKKDLRGIQEKEKNALVGWLAEVQLLKATILDHFTMAYMADSGLGPKDVKLLQNKLPNGSVEFIFEKNSSIIMPGDIG